MTYTISRIGLTGWYNFEDLPQGYIKVCNLNCGTDKNAIKQAKRILGDKTATIVIEQGVK